MSEPIVPEAGAVFYLRMSTDKQETSIPQQRDELQRFADKQGYRLVREYVEPGISGDDTERREAFQQMTRDAGKRADFDLILCYDLSRFGRFDPLEAGYWIKPLRDAGVRLETLADGRIDWESFAGRITYTIAQEGKHAYLTDLSRNVLRGLRDAAKLGSWLGGTAPYAYRLNDVKRLEPGDSVQVEVVRWLFTTYANTFTSLGELARQLNARGVPGPAGKLWQKTTIHKILIRPAYLGHSVWNRKSKGSYHEVKAGEVRKAARKRDKIANDPCDWIEVRDTHPALVDQATWDRVQQRLVRNHHHRPRTGRLYLFTGLLWCGHCGWPMHGSLQGGRCSYQRYVCGNYNLHGSSVCKCNTVLERDVLAHVVGAIRNDFLDPANLDLLRQEVRRQEEAERGGANPSADLDKRIAALRAKIDRDAEKWFEAPPSLTGILGAKLEEKRVELARLEEERRGLAKPAQTEDDLDAAVGEIVAGLDKLEAPGADPALLRDVVQQLVERIDLRFKHIPYGGKRLKSVLVGGKIRLRPDLVVSRDVPPDPPVSTMP
jgi:DNA invertase Pin-like site-specific DNA recombinase